MTKPHNLAGEQEKWFLMIRTTNKLFQLKRHFTQGSFFSRGEGINLASAERALAHGHLKSTRLTASMRLAPARNCPIFAGSSRTYYPQCFSYLLIRKIWHLQIYLDQVGWTVQHDSEYKTAGAESRTNQFPHIVKETMLR